MIRRICLLALIVSCFCITAAAQTENVQTDCVRYNPTTETTSLAVFGSVPRFRNQNDLRAMELKTAAELGLGDAEVWNEYPTYAIKVIMSPCARIWVDTASKEPRYLDGCRWNGKYHPNRVKVIRKKTIIPPSTPAAPVVTATTLTVTKTGSVAVVQLNQPVQYTIVLKNTGTVAAKSIQLRDSIASTAGVTVVPGLSVSMSYTGTLTSMTFTQDLAPGAEITIVYTATLATAGLQVPNIVTVWAANAPPVYAQVVVSTPPPSAPTIEACPVNTVRTGATLKQKLLGGWEELTLSVGVGVAGAGIFSSSGQKGKQMVYSGVYSAVANRVANYLNPDHNIAYLVTPGGIEGPRIKRGDQPGQFTVGGLTYSYEWTERRIVITLAERGCQWSASPKQSFNFTPVPIIKRVQMKTTTVVVTQPAPQPKKPKCKNCKEPL